MEATRFECQTLASRRPPSRSCGRSTCCWRKAGPSARRPRGTGSKLCCFDNQGTIEPLVTIVTTDQIHRFRESRIGRSNLPNELEISTSRSTKRSGKCVEIARRNVGNGNEGQPVRAPTFGRIARAQVAPFARRKAVVLESEQRNRVCA